MSLIDKLLKADAGKADQVETGIFKSKRLAKIMESEEPIEVVIREIPPKRTNELMAMMLDKKGNADMSKLFDTKALMVAEGVTDPDLKSPDLAKHFGCATPRDLAIKLFGGEINQMSDEIVNLSGFGSVEESDEEIKN